MTSLRFCLTAAAIIVATSTPGLSQLPTGGILGPGDTIPVLPLPDLPKQVPKSDGIGNTKVFLKNYETFKNNQRRSADPDALIIPLGQVSGHARSFTSAAGSLSLNLRTGRYIITLAGTTEGRTYYVWFIDQGIPSDPADDKSFLFTSILAKASTATLEGQLSDSAASFSIDKVVVTLDGTRPANPLASGSITVLQKLFFSGATLTILGLPVAEGGLVGKFLPFASVVPDPVLPILGLPIVALNEGTKSPPSSTTAGGPKLSSVPIDTLVKKGSKLFFEETFKGNGRTCGTCHPAHNNLTIDPAFIATLPGTDPLFVAETNPALAQLEKPALMRQFGLILENLDGLNAPTTKFVMRSVPHTLGMTVSLIQDSAQINPPAQMTGWSGDGAPGTGSLRDFATGAVTQHFPKTLARIDGEDFDLPKEKDLDAMEAFQLSLGRTEDFDLNKLQFQDSNVNIGKNLFLNGTGDPLAGQKCTVCHGNGGAIAANGQNRNFNTNVEDRVNPARTLLPFPIDGGFGVTPNLDGSFGNRSFNTPSLVEAADTPPFFHNNVETTLESAVAFYTGPEFNNPRAPAGRFILSTTQISQIANFLRALNTLQNIDIAKRELTEVLSFNGNTPVETTSRLATAFNETTDVIRVLNQTAIYPNVVAQVTSARQSIVQAQGTNNPNQRDQFVQSAITTLTGARALVATVLP